MSAPSASPPSAPAIRPSGPAPPSPRWQRERSVPYGTLFLMVAPNLVWILLDRGKWVSDTSLYALDATRLHHALVHDPSGWWSAMLAVGPKPPLLPWAGQFFVAIGHLIGNVDIGLLLLAFAAQCLALWFLAQALHEALGRRSLALFGCLALASAPMFIFVSTQFYVQPIQLLAVCWFLYIMVQSRTWDALLTLSHLTTASAVALLATMSSPLYCAVPGGIALHRAWVNRATPIRPRAAHVGALLLAVVSTALAAAWYLENFEAAIDYGRFGYSFAYGAEVRDVFLLKLIEWTRYVWFGFALSALITLLLPWGLLSRLRKEGFGWQGDAAVMLLLCAQIGIVLVVVASSAHQTFRYVLPLLPYFAVLGTWSLSEVDGNGLRRVLTLALVLQLAATQLGLHFWDDGRFARERQEYRAALDAVAQVTGDRRDTVWMGLGRLGVFDFDAAYHASKSHGYHQGGAPRYQSIEIAFTNPDIDGDVEALWRRIDGTPGAHVVLTRSSPPVPDASRPHDVWRSVDRAAAEIADRVRNSARFERVATPEAWDVEVYRRVTPGPR